MAKQKKPSNRSAAGFGSQRLMTQLSKAETFRRQRKFDKALAILEPLEEEYPNDANVLGCLANLYHAIKHFPKYEETCDRLHQINPNDPDITLMLAAACLANNHPILALQNFRYAVEKWPSHRRADEARELIKQLESGVQEILAEKGFAGEDALEVGALHEKSQAKLQSGNYVEARRLNEELLRHRPDFVSALNNLSLTYFLDSQLDEAIATAKRGLELDSENYHALSNLTRFCFLKGEINEAKQWCDRLKTVESDFDDVWIKKAEGLSYLADYRGVLDAFQGAEKAGALKSSSESALLYHLAAVASYYLGEEKQARQYWQQALKIYPGLDLAQDNTDNLNQPVSKRHAPWAFSLRYWLTPKALEDVRAIFLSQTEGGEEEDVPQVIETYFRQHPEIAKLVPIFLDRGDPSVRQFALNLAMAAETPEMFAALRDFALSDKGSDDMRLQAAQAASKAGLFPEETARLWIRGEWQELLLMGFEVHDEAVNLHAPKVEELYRQAILAARAGEAVQAEKLIKKALELEPDAPDLLNNLAGSYAMQGRDRESVEILKQIHQRHPDYLFARAGLARMHLQNGEIEKAEELVQPLLTRKRLHYSELVTLAGFQIELNLIKNQTNAAASWLQMLENAVPDHPNVAYWRKQLNKAIAKQPGASRTWKIKE